MHKRLVMHVMHLYELQLDEEGQTSAAEAGEAWRVSSVTGVGQVDAQKPDPIGVPNGACIDPSMVLTPWV